MISLRKQPPVIVGAVPRADLLPPEIKAGKKLKSQRRGLMAALIAVVVVTAAAYAGATYLSQTRADALAAANARTAEIVADQVQYAELAQANTAIAAAEAARISATTTEIDWSSEIADVVGTLPDGAELTALTVTSSTATLPLTSPVSPLEGDRVAELQLTVNTKGIPDTAKWIRDLATLNGFVDATPTSIAATGGAVSTTLTLHLNSAVYWNRFATEAGK